MTKIHVHALIYRAVYLWPFCIILPVQAVTDAHRGNLNAAEAAEAACEDLTDTDTDNSTLFQARSNRSAFNDMKFKEEDILVSLEKYKSVRRAT